MSDEIEFDADGNEITPAPKGPAALRQAYDALKARLEAAEAENKTLSSAKRASDLAELLEKAGAPKRLARYAKDDITELTSDNVLAWLNENGEDFGWTPSDPDDEDDEVDTQQNARRVTGATDNARKRGTGSDTELLHKLRTLTPQQLMEQGLI